MEIIKAKDIKKGFNIGIAVSRFRENITQKLLEGAVTRLKELEFSEDQINIAWVPGALELPVTAQRFAKTGKIDAVICLGCVMRGETTHYDYVCSVSCEGLQRVVLDTGIPVIQGILTTENEEQAMARIFKGRAAVDTAYEMVSVLSQI